MSIHTINLASKVFSLKVITSSFYKNLKMEILLSVNNSAITNCSLLATYEMQLLSQMFWFELRLLENFLFPLSINIPLFSHWRYFMNMKIINRIFAPFQWRHGLYQSSRCFQQKPCFWRPQTWCPPLTWPRLCCWPLKNIQQKTHRYPE